MRVSFVASLLLASTVIAAPSPWFGHSSSSPSTTDSSTSPSPSHDHTNDKNLRGKIVGCFLGWKAASKWMPKKTKADGSEKQTSVVVKLAACVLSAEFAGLAEGELKNFLESHRTASGSLSGSGKLSLDADDSDHDGQSNSTVSGISSSGSSGKSEASAHSESSGDSESSSYASSTSSSSSESTDHVSSGMEKMTELMASSHAGSSESLLAEEVAGLELEEKELLAWANTMERPSNPLAEASSESTEILLE